MLIRRVLVPVDFSPRSRPALEYASAMAAMAHAAVDVVHVVPAPGALRIAADVWLGRDVPHASPVDVLDARTHLQHLIHSCDRHDIVPILHVAAGDAAATIVRLAAELPADLIVIGTRGRHSVGELALGSVAQRVIACSPCPVVALGREVLQRLAP